jgi:uncharacterized coiled-coil protein SlyX
MTFNAIFFALGFIALPAVSVAVKVFYVFSTGKTWKTQHDIEFEKARIRSSSFVSNLNSRMEELQSQCVSQLQEIDHLNNILSAKDKDSFSTSKQNSFLQEENSKLKLGLESLLERLEDAEKKLGK